MGRCSDYILKDRSDVLNVFIHAPKPLRAERIVKLYGESDEAPEKRLDDKDARRKVNYRHFTGREWGAAQNYHLSLDSGALGIETCVDIIAAAFRPEPGHDAGLHLNLRGARARAKQSIPSRLRGLPRSGAKMCGAKAASAALPPRRVPLFTPRQARRRARKPAPAFPVSARAARGEDRPERAFTAPNEPSLQNLPR